MRAAASIRLPIFRLAGDANLDAVLNSADLVQILERGKYEDASHCISTWADGDWNGDGDFTRADLVFALSHGDHLSG